MNLGGVGGSGAGFCVREGDLQNSMTGRNYFSPFLRSFFSQAALPRSRAGPQLSGWIAKHKGWAGPRLGSLRGGKTEGGTRDPLDQLYRRHGVIQH